MTATPPPPPTHALLVTNLLAQLAFGLLAMTICLPSMQEWASIFDASQASVQLTFSGYVVAYGGLQLLYGPLSDRLGRKNILLFGLFVAGVGSVLAALSPNLGLLTLARVLQGAGSAAGMVVGRAMVQDLFQGPARTRVMAYIGMTMGLCPPLATIIGGQLHVRLGWQSNFVLMAVLAAVLFVAAWRGLPDHQKATTVQPHWLRAMGASYARLAREPAFILYVALLSMITATFYTFLSGAPIVLGSYGVGPEGIGYYIMSIPLAYIVGNYLTSHLVHRTGDRPMMLLGQALTLSGVALMLGLALAGWHSPLAFALPLILLGIGHGFLVPPALAGTVSLVPALAGSAAAVAGLMQQMMGAVGGFTVGLFTHEGAVNLGLLMLGFALCAAVAQGLLHRLIARSARQGR
ncbi:MAG: multidrug effflux MFS transporter [Hydrogenophaga sp.]|uniref:multidrug effflux MFS transporter n=1 Tax=Hydrogenophaga sp. TaxID=1904254 RepID=UPI002734ED2F|nr:multidrug effflux MFS transporter [Hydrogenophaga sp.]MDP3344169.1 multidrug effflux MFS transporter [Hydrogenophaga sp.]MDP3808456.1 multidrug effflux MFS transporter [Hydrogenophaga sp.]